MKKISLYRFLQDLSKLNAEVNFNFVDRSLDDITSFFFTAYSGYESLQNGFAIDAH